MLPIKILDIKTPSGKSTSFANPNIVKIAEKYIVSYFMPSEGNDAHENGDLIYIVDDPLKNDLL